MEGEQSALFQKDHELAEHIAHEWTSPRRSKRAKTQITPKKSEISSLEEEANAIYSLDVSPTHLTPRSLIKLNFWLARSKET
jgi:hypothetical protein